MFGKKKNTYDRIQRLNQEEAKVKALQQQNKLSRMERKVRNDKYSAYAEKYHVNKIAKKLSSFGKKSISSKKVKPVRRSFSGHTKRTRHITRATKSNRGGSSGLDWSAKSNKPSNHGSDLDMFSPQNRSNHGDDLDIFSRGNNRNNKKSSSRWDLFK